MTALERFDELVSNYLDEALDPEGMAELNSLLATRPDYAVRFVRLSRLHGGLREIEGPGAVATRPPRRILLVASGAAAAAALLVLSFIAIRPPARPVPGGVLLVVGKVDPLLPGDQAVKERLEGRGHAVTPVLEAQADPALAKGRALVLISESTLSSEVGSRFTKLAVPLLNCEPNLNGSLRLSARPPVPRQSYSKHPQQRVRIVDSSHPLAAGLTGSVAVYGKGDSWMGWGEPDTSAVRIATLDGPDREACLFGYEAGSRVREETLPARRVFFFMPNPTQEATRMSAEGWRLFDAAVDWCLAGR